MGPKPKTRRHLEKIGFQAGSSSPLKGKKLSYVPPDEPSKYARMSNEALESRVDDAQGTLSFKDVDGSVTNVSPLRPLTRQTRLVDQYDTPSDTGIHPDLLTNRLYCPYLVQNMFNCEIKAHFVTDGCPGELNFDAEKPRKWGLGWSERLKCTKCKYVSQYYRLYTEVEREGRGRRAAEVNVGLQLGLMSTPCSSAGAQRLLLNAQIEPPCQTSMQNMANKVGKHVTECNINNMHEVRQSLKEENEKCGNKFKSAVLTESDSCYNNPLFNTDSTPFQAGTIVATTVCENNTKGKKIIGVHVGVKICPNASKLRNKGEKVDCPNHRGHCTANLKESDSIGDEGRWNEIVSREIKQDLNIVGHTTDGDSKAHTGIQNGQGIQVLSLKDIRHLGNSLRREINKAPFSSAMFKGRNKSNLKSRFALSVRIRCVAELKKAHALYKGNMKQIRSKMPNTVSAVILCFRGYCGNQCKKHSLVCPGNQKQMHNYLPHSTKLSMTPTDIQVLEKCINVLLGRDNLLKTRLMTSTQKCEAVNRSYQASMPKQVTFARNCHGRIHGQILRLNHGRADSTILMAKAVNLKLVRGSRVMKRLRKLDDNDRRRKSASYIKQAKVSRYAARQRRYNAHTELHYQKGISDPKPDYSGIPNCDHNYA